MSVPTARQAYTFLTPLESKSSTFVMGSSEAKISFGRFLFGCLEVTKTRARILDVDAFFGSNATEVASASSTVFLESVLLSVPRSFAALDEWLIDQLTHSVETNALILDDLNSVYHSISMENPKSALKKLSVIMALLSFLARTRRQVALSTLYQRERLTQVEVGRRSLARLGELTISVAMESGTLSFECTRGNAWKGGAFSVALSP